MKRYLRASCLVAGLLVLPNVSLAGVFDDVNCGLNSLLGGNACEIEKINEFQEEKQGEWMRGSITAMEAVKAIVEFHRRLTPLNNYDKELYSYYVQVAQACDAGKIPKERGLYLMTKKDNEIGERIRANQPPIRQPLKCTSERFGSTITTNCE